jgi:hypothetical protein
LRLISEIDPIVIRTLGELVTFVAKTCTSEIPIPWFRGHREAHWEVRPSLWRKHTPEDERNFTNRFRVRAALRRPAAPKEDDYPAWLSLMQHYGLPTRLLDWSRSPLVAAYFAVRSYRKKDTKAADAAIWMLDPHLMNNLLFGNDLTFPIDSSTAKEMLDPAFKDRKDDKDVLAVMAVEHDMRMFVQQGAFTIHAARDALNERKGHSQYLKPLLIPAEAVQQVAWETFACGFRRGDLFPDLAKLQQSADLHRRPLAAARRRNATLLQARCNGPQ